MKRTKWGRRWWIALVAALALAALVGASARKHLQALTLLQTLSGAPATPTTVPRVQDFYVNHGRARAYVPLVDAASGVPMVLVHGIHHRGIDDCRNIARLVRALAQQGSTFEITGALPALPCTTLTLPPWSLASASGTTL